MCTEGIYTFVHVANLHVILKTLVHNYYDWTISVTHGMQCNIHNMKK